MKSAWKMHVFYFENIEGIPAFNHFQLPGSVKHRVMMLGYYWAISAGLGLVLG